MKKTFAIAVISILCLSLLAGGYLVYKNDNRSEKPMTDAEKFKKEYSLVSDNNPFVYRTIDEIINILENGSGIVYLGFTECPWCQQYVKYLDEVARDKEVEKIYYFNIKEDREKNTDKYQKIVSILEDSLDYDDEGNKRVFVPDVTFISNGSIVGHNNETSLATSADGTPEEYWTDKKIENLKTTISKYIDTIKENEPCNTGCN